VPASWSSIPLPGTKIRLGFGLAAALAVTAGLTGAAVVGGRADGETVTALAMGAGVIASVLVHEGAHAFAARSLGYRVEWILLGLLAGTTSYSGRDDRPLDRAAIAMAGPAANAAAVLVLPAAWASGTAGLSDAMFALLSLNALSVVVNLAPVPGSDGWQVAARLFEHWGREPAPAPVPVPASAGQDEDGAGLS
jgi:Zn-dependent protease